jgi:hypothetical protein
MKTLAIYGAAAGLFAAIGAVTVKLNDRGQQYNTAPTVVITMPSNPPEDPRYFDHLGEEGHTYNHCKVCDIGVLLPHDGGVVKCTYCGKE